MSNLRDMEFEGFGWRQSQAMPVADPEVLARAVRAHKVGDAMAQAALTIALMIAIGAVAFVLSATGAAAGELFVGSVIAHSAALAAAALCGGALLLGRIVLRRARAAHRR